MTHTRLIPAWATRAAWLKFNQTIEEHRGLSNTRAYEVFERVPGGEFYSVPFDIGWDAARPLLMEAVGLNPEAAWDYASLFDQGASTKPRGTVLGEDLPAVAEPWWPIMLH